MLLHGTVRRGYYVFKAFYYQLLLLKVTMYSHYNEIYIYLLRNNNKKRKPRIDGCTVHILGPILEAMN